MKRVTEFYKQADWSDILFLSSKGEYLYILHLGFLPTPVLPLRKFEQKAVIFAEADDVSRPLKRAPTRG
jgi:hypothetical protein